VDRKNPESRQKSRTEVASRLAQGVSVVVFPEGTTTAGPGLKPFRTGSFQGAAGGEIPVVPVAVVYVHREDAWIGDDTFVGHFLRVFSRPRTDIFLAFGPQLRSSETATLQQQAWDWCEARVGAIESVLGL